MVNRLYVALAISKAYLHSLFEGQLLKLHQSRPVSAKCCAVIHTPSDPEELEASWCSMRRSWVRLPRS